MPIVIEPDASDSVKASAEDLREKLSQITGASFELKDADPRERCIYVGEPFDVPDNLYEADGFEIKTHSDGIDILGNGPSGVRNGVWWLLYHLGYRQFMPTKQWEVIPHKPSLGVRLNTVQKPSFWNRNAPRPTSWTDDDAWNDWRKKNLFNNAFGISTGHAYAAIIRRHQEEFDAHPEYLNGNKFRVSEPGLVDLVVKDAVDRFHENPSMTSISMDPSDGGGWATDEQEMAFLPQVSDRVVYLANKVAEAINDLGYGEKYVGIYAYNQHAPPPDTVTPHPNVVVSIATSYARGGYTSEELVRLWGEKANLLGLRDFYGTFTSSQGMPRRGRGGNVNYVKSWLPFCHENGVRFARASPTDSWPTDGLGYYISSRLQWDVNADVDEMVEDFIEKCFPECLSSASRFYELVAFGRDRPRTPSDLIFNMYAALNSAYEVTTDPATIQRLHDMTLYTRYCEMFFNWSDQQSAEATYNHTYRMISRMMSPTIQLYRYFRRSRVNVDVDRDVLNPGNSYTVGEELKYIPGWQENIEPFTSEDIARYVVNGLVNNEPDAMDFDYVEYDHETLVPATPLNLPEVSTGIIGRYSSSRGYNSAFVWLEEGQNLKLNVKGGSIHGDRGDVRLFLDSPLDDEGHVDEASVPNDNVYHSITLKSPHIGFHILSWYDGGDRTHLRWDYGQPVTLHVGLSNAFSFQSDPVLYFYVPKGTKTVGGFMTRQDEAEIRTPIRTVQDWQGEDNTGYFNIPVQEGEDGTLWRVYCNKRFTLRLMSVPPYLARNERELMLPEEVVEKDK